MLKKSDLMVMIRLRRMANKGLTRKQASVSMSGYSRKSVSELRAILKDEPLKK